MIRQKENRVILSITVKTKQPKFKIQFKEHKIYVYLKEQPQKNYANIELVKMFKKVLKRPVILISGQKSKTKKLAVEATTTDEIINSLKKYQE